MKSVHAFGCILLALVIGFGAGCAKKKSKTAADNDDKSKSGQVAKNDNGKSTTGPTNNGGNQGIRTTNGNNTTTGNGTKTGTDKLPTRAKKPGHVDIKKPGQLGGPTKPGVGTPIESGSGAKRKLRGPRLGDQD